MSALREVEEVVEDRGGEDVVAEDIAPLGG
jgi:hypothetical protein